MRILMQLSQVLLPSSFFLQNDVQLFNNGPIDQFSIVIILNPIYYFDDSI
jgi:hypothetical protein